MHPDPKELPAFCLIAAGAAGTQLVMKLIMWFGRHPERELGVMLRELRVATAAALESANSPAHERVLPARLDRVDSLWRAITAWQANFRTDTFTNWDARTLALRILDACVHSEEACRLLAVGLSSDEEHEAALTHVLATLDDRTLAGRLAKAREWAHAVVSEVDSHEASPSDHNDLCDYRFAECVLAHAQLRDIQLHPRNLPRGGPDTSSPPLPRPPLRTARRRPPRRHPTPGITLCAHGGHRGATGHPPAAWRSRP